MSDSGERKLTASKGPATAAMVLAYVLGGIGLALAGGRSTIDALEVVTALTVGGVGVSSFVRHVVFARGDAARLGWGAEGGSNFQLEVGFANLAFGVTALWAYFGEWGTGAEVAITFGYGVYLGQTGLLHLRSFIRGEKRTAGQFITSVLTSFAISIGLIYVALNAADAARSAVRHDRHRMG